MLNIRRYYVGRQECWGGTYVWIVRDSERHAPYQAGIVGKVYHTERAAKKACERANVDLRSFYEKLR